MSTLTGLSLLLISGITGGLFSIGYKQSIRRHTSSFMFLRYYSLSFFLCSLIGSMIFGEFMFNQNLIIYGVCNGISMFIAIMCYFQLIQYKNLNITWTVLQFNIIIPFSISLLIFKERIGVFALTGCMFMVLALILFGLGKRTPTSVQKKINGRLSLLLFFASMFSGIAVSFPKIYTATTNDTKPFALMVVSSGIMAILAISHLLLNRQHEASKSLGLLMMRSYKRSQAPFFMSLFQLISMITLIISLKSIPGAIAYPTRSLISLITVYSFAFLLFKETFHKLEKFGVVMSMIAIGFISYAM